MKHNYINLRHILLCLCLLTGINASAYDAYYDAYIGGIYYYFFGNEAHVTSDYPYYPPAYFGDVTIPAFVTYNEEIYSVTSISTSAFLNCSGLTSVTIPNSVTSIGDCAFEGCTGLTSITIPNSVTSIGEYAFEGCRSLTSVTIPYGVTSIAWGTFEACIGLTSVTIPNSVTSIDNDAFYSCSSLTSITIPNSVTNIGVRVFWDCSSLTSVTIPNSVISIGRCAFYGCTGLTSVTIGNSVTNINEYTFERCSGLTSVTIGNSVTSIGYGAFSDCRSLTSVTIPNSVTSIGGLAFSDCSGLTSFTIPESVTEIGAYLEESAFVGCYFLRERFINNSGLTDSNNWGAVLYDDGTETSDGLTIIDNTIIKCRPWATSITIPGSVTSIGEGAFSGCSSITSVTVEEGNSIFDSRNKCNAIIETATNTLIIGCQNTVIPNSVTSIGDYAFSGCSGLTSITIPNGVTSIGGWAFYRCTGLTSITIPNSVTSIENYAFFYCTGLTSITIPNSVTSIGNGAFWNCSSLTSVTISGSVTSIGSYAFRDCNSLKEIYCYAEEAPEVSYNSFWDVDVSKVLLVVPNDAVEKYRSHSVWGQFMIETPTDISLTPAPSPVRDGNWYDLSGRKMANGKLSNVQLPRGLYIVNGRKVVK